MKYDLVQAVRAACLWLPEAEETMSHGMPSYRVRGKTYAYFVVNHHGDGRLALWLNAPAGAQETLVRNDARHFFVPPYLGPRGWLGVHLNRGLDWRQIAELVRESYLKVAPAKLEPTLPSIPKIRAPRSIPADAAIEPLKAPRGRKRLTAMRKICLALPETREVRQFGHPAWQAGKKTFASIRTKADSVAAGFWVGVDKQNLLTADERFRIPPYTGHLGWVSLDIGDRCDFDEIHALALASYRHFALRRMLAQLED